MSDTLHLSIISPSRVVLDAYATAVEIPGAEGVFTALPEHAAFFSMLKPGVVTVTLADGFHRSFFATSGYAEVNAQGCTLLSDHVQEIADISPADAAEALRLAQQALSDATTDAQRMRAEQLLYAAQELVRAVG